MLGHTANAKKSSKFEDSDGRMSRPRTHGQCQEEQQVRGLGRSHVKAQAVSELTQRPAQRLKPPPAAGAEATGATPRRALGVRGPAPRSPLHEKKPAGAGAGAGAGPRVAELEAKLEKAHGQLMGMRDQLAAAEKARKDARAALVEAKKRFATKKRDDAATSAPPVEHDDGNKVPVPAPADEASCGAVVANGEKGYMTSPGTDAFEAVAASESSGNHEGPVVEEGNKTSSDEEEASKAVADEHGKKGSGPEVELRAKLMAKDMEVYELRAKLMVIDAEVDDMKGKVMAKGTELDELKAKLMLNAELVDKLTANLTVKDAKIASLEGENSDLTRMAEEAAEAAKAAVARAKETEHALRESAAREARLAERLRASEHAREAMEAEARRSRVQSEQWRKAAEEAPAVLGGGGGVDRDAGGGSLDKRRHGSASNGGGDSESTAAKDGDEEGPSGKRKAGGAMRALSDLWKKKAQK